MKKIHSEYFKNSECWYKFVKTSNGWFYGYQLPDDWEPWMYHGYHFEPYGTETGFSTLEEAVRDFCNYKYVSFEDSCFFEEFGGACHEDI